jgi:hypothetical protein
MEPLEFETRIVNGIPIQVAIYSGSVFRVDKEDDPWYIKHGSPAPFKYFTETEEEAKSGYSKHGQLLRIYSTRRPLVLANMYDLATRNAIHAFMKNDEKPHLDFSFPLNGMHVSRRSEEGYTYHNYGVSDVICRLSAHGIDGYYIAKGHFHSEIMVCRDALNPDVLHFEESHRISPKQLKRPRPTWRNNNDNDTVNFTPMRPFVPAFSFNSPPRKRFKTLRLRKRLRKSVRNSR